MNRQAGVFLLLMTVLSFGMHGQQTIGLTTYQEGSNTGLTLLSPIFSSRVFLLDNCGELVHEWQCSTRPGLSTYLLEDGTLLRTGSLSSNRFSGGGLGGLIELLDWDSNVLWSYTLAEDSIHAHHDIEPLPNGNILALLWSYLPQDEATALGRSNMIVEEEGLWPTEVVELQPLGTDSAAVVWRWRMVDHIIQDLQSTMPNYGSLSEHPELMDINYYIPSNGYADWLHCNSIDYNAELDQILISSRSLSEVFIIDHSTTTAEAASHTGGNSGKGGDLLYRFGRPLNYDRGNASDRILHLQHDARWIPDEYPAGGSIMVFDNQGVTEDVSSVYTFTPPSSSPGTYIIPESDPIGPTAPDWSYSAPDFFSSNISGAERLANGNTLICEGRSGRLFEVNLDGDILWEYINPVQLPDVVLSQGTTPTSNTVFRTTRYPVDYPAFQGVTLIPSGPLELNPILNECIIMDIEEASAEQRFSIKHSHHYIRVQAPAEPSLVIRIVDLHGKSIYNQALVHGSADISTSSWKSGLYIIQVYGDKWSSQHKFCLLR